MSPQRDNAVVSHEASYEAWAQELFKGVGLIPNTLPATSWTLDTPEGLKTTQAMQQIEYEYVYKLLRDVLGSVSGAIVEFGVYNGDWLEVLAESCDKLGLQREVYGFDSFEGLPEPSHHDLACWHKGMYKSSLAEVRERLKVDQRDFVHLIPGWFEQSLKTEEAQRIKRVAFARIDCDLYMSTVPCLEFLESRLDHGAILVFDDWTFRLDKGETKAFYEWSQRATHLGFEFLCFNSIGHFYMRVLQGGVLNHPEPGN